MPNGVVDIAVRSEEEAVAVAKKYLSYFQASAGVPSSSAQPSPAPPGGPLKTILPDSTDNFGSWNCADQRLLRHAVPENRLRAYDVRA